MFASKLLYHSRSYIRRYRALESIFLLLLIAEGQELAQASQSAHTPELTASWLQESRLSGAKLAGHANQPVVHVDIEGFYGEVIAATVSHPQFKKSRTLLHPLDLKGMRWQVQRCQLVAQRNHCQNTHLRIVSVAPAPVPASGPPLSRFGRTWLYEVEYADTYAPTHRDWRKLCQTVDKSGIFVSGQWTLNGRWSPQGYTFACPDSAVFRCASKLGYSPWARTKNSSGQSVDLGPLHLACVRALRGDYCGDGTPHRSVRRSAVIDVSDYYGFHTASGNNQLELEAVFTPSGASWLPGRASFQLSSCSSARRRRGRASTGANLIWINSTP